MEYSRRIERMLVQRIAAAKSASARAILSKRLAAERRQLAEAVARLAFPQAADNADELAKRYREAEGRPGLKLKPKFRNIARIVIPARDGDGIW